MSDLALTVEGLASSIAAARHRVEQGHTVDLAPLTAPVDQLARRRALLPQADKQAAYGVLLGLVDELYALEHELAIGRSKLLVNLGELQRAKRARGAYAQGRARL